MNKDDHDGDDGDGNENTVGWILIVLNANNKQTNNLNQDYNDDVCL